MKYERRTRGLYKSESTTPFSVSRSKIELFVECPRCFWIDRVKGVSRPAGFPFNLNSAVDTLLKKEFDALRTEGNPHHLMTSAKISAVPYDHPRIDEFREVFKGIRFLHEPTHLEVFGAVDDIWINDVGELHVVDYKATSKEGSVTITAEWQAGYRRQVEVYQWLLRSLGFTVSDTAYFVYANGIRDREAFDARLEFDVSLLAYQGSTSWIEPKLLALKECLDKTDAPAPSDTCEYCGYYEVLNEVLNPTSIHELNGTLFDP